MKKSLFCKYCSNPLEDDGTCKMCPKGNKRVNADQIDRTCPFNDHGNVCGKYGTMADSTNGTGPFYCSPHYWQLKGWPIRTEDVKPPISYRERWYADNGKTYQPPKMKSENLKEWTAMHGYAPQRQREPGDDDDEPILQP